MNTFIRKAVLALTTFMSVNSAFANSLTPTPENKGLNGVISTKNVESKRKEIANSLPPTMEDKALANSLPPTMEGKALANSLPPTMEGKALANSLPPTLEGKALANSLPPTLEAPKKVLSQKAIRFIIRDTQNVRMA